MTENLVPGGEATFDVLNASWRDYGNRVGAWRLMAMIQRELGLPLSILLNTALYDEAPALCEAFRASGCEIVAHGRSNSDTMAGMSEDAERTYIAEVTNAIKDHEGRPPAGWASPWIAETPTTPETLVGSGYRYVLDWCMDDQPCWLKTRAGRLLSIPYSQEINDSSTIIGRMTSASEFADMIVDHFDQLLEDSREQPVVMSVILHSFIAGQPFRLRQIRRALAHIVARREQLWLTTPGQIAEFIHAQPDNGGLSIRTPHCRLEPPLNLHVRIVSVMRLTTHHWNRADLQMVRRAVSQCHRCSAGAEL